jgi:hypothetical protein
MIAMQMRAWMVGITVVVAIGLVWSVVVISNLVPVDGSEIQGCHRGALIVACPMPDPMRRPR